MGSNPPVPPIPKPGQPPIDPPQPCATEQPVEETADVAVPDATQDAPAVSVTARYADPAMNVPDENTDL